MTDEERFFSYVKYSEGCWEWTGALNNCGYGQVSMNGRPKRVHRWSYEYFIGSVGFV